MTLQGKGFFTFIISDTEGGNPGAILAAAQAASLSHVLVKIADGVRPFGLDGSGADITFPVVQALRAAGIAVWGWHYVRGDDPAGEAKIAVQRAQGLGLDGYVVDAEEEYKTPGREAAARQFMSAVRGALTVPVALSSYRFPNYHPELPWSAFLEKCDYHMPQVYWEQAHNAGDQLRESKKQCDALPNARPYIPTGAAYNVTGWDPTPADVTDFLTSARALGLSAVNFFQWSSCRQALPQVWSTIAKFDWSAPVQVTSTVPTETGSSAGVTSGTSSTGTTASTTPPPPSSDVFTNQFLAALNSRKAGQAAALYDPAGVRVWGDDIQHRTISIQAGYATFFAGLPSGTAFSLANLEVDSDVRYIDWQAGSLTGETTLILKNGKITWDYTFLD
ncbi:MAG TPA: hypothetical protein VMC09_11200 [Anaerolineales bacterium]|nr:hypothetical protein [Anaerolineales bacterium]